MKSILKAASILLLISIFLTACAQDAQPTQQFEALVASTVAVMQTQEALMASITLIAPATETPIPPTFTPTLVQPTPTRTRVTPTRVTPTPSQSYCISTYTNVNVPNNSVFKGGETFTKKWILTNGGSAVWTTDFKLISVNGDSMNASPVSLERVIYPGKTVEVSVDLMAPIQAGNHQANFMLLTDRGEKFGIGPNCDRSLGVLICTKNLFSVTSAVVHASPASYTGACPTTINLTTSIAANGTGTVTYVIITSTGRSETYQMDFNGSKTITSSQIPWKVTSSMDLKVHIYVDIPNHQDFKEITIPITCTS